MDKKTVPIFTMIGSMIVGLCPSFYLIGKHFTTTGLHSAVMDIVMLGVVFIGANIIVAGGKKWDQDPELQIRSYRLFEWLFFLFSILGFGSVILLFLDGR